MTKLEKIHNTIKVQGFGKVTIKKKVIKPNEVIDENDEDEREEEEGIQLKMYKKILWKKSY